MSKSIIVALAAVALSLPALAQKTVPVKPQVTKRGSVVRPHQRTAPNQTKMDNWSTKGNQNPMTGKKGTKQPYSVPRRRN